MDSRSPSALLGSQHSALSDNRRPCRFCGTYCYGRHAHPPVEAVDYPQVGEWVIYTMGDGSGERLAQVLRVADHDGDAELDYGKGPELSAMDVKQGNGERHTYRRIPLPEGPS